MTDSSTAYSTNRSAEFVEPESDRTDGPPSSRVIESQPRRAAYRPSPAPKGHTESLERFRRELERDIRHIDGAEPEIAKSLLGIGLAAEVTGNLDSAANAAERLRHVGLLSRQAGALERRVARAAQQTSSELEQLLEDAVQGQSDAYSSLLELELASHRWGRQKSAAGVVDLLESTSPDAVDRVEGLGNFWLIWRNQLMTDVLLEKGEVERAFTRISSTAEKVDGQTPTRILQSRLAVWKHVHSGNRAARHLLADILEDGQLPGDLLDLYVYLCFEADREDEVQELAARTEPFDSTASVGLPIVSMFGRRQSYTEALDFLQKIQPVSEVQHRTLLYIQEGLLHRSQSESHGQVQSASDLISVLNERLERCQSDDEVLAILTRLGHLYEAEAQLDEAAAEVYREALDIRSDYEPAVRALVSLYTRNENWQSLAELYEQYIARAEAEDVWSYKFRLAKLYDERLEKPEDALHYYRQVLDEKTYYLPALKATARLLKESSSWGRLVKLFRSAVSEAPNSRQKMYLLLKVAHLSEHKLDDIQGAIQAWEHILTLDSTHPQAYAALGRLYSETAAWASLIDLNEREAESVESSREVANLYVKNAKIADKRLCDPELAEKWYRKALNSEPSFLPAIESLAQYYMEHERWNDLVEIVTEELRVTSDERNAMQRLHLLADVFEGQYGSPEKAIQIYEKILEIEPSSREALEALIRLYQRVEQWKDLVRVLEQKLEHAADDEVEAQVHGQLARVFEWNLQRTEAALTHYRHALELEPQNATWLEGVSRTWRAGECGPEQVASFLEDRLLSEMNGPTRDRYFKIIARLRERAEQSAEVSRAYRFHGANDSVENQFLMQLAMAQEGERQQLKELRRTIPQHCLEQLAEIDRIDLSNEDKDVLTQTAPKLTDAEREFLFAEVDAGLQLDGHADLLPTDRLISTDLLRVHEGQPFLPSGKGASKRLIFRMKALSAEGHTDWSAYTKWTARELDKTDNAALHILRRIQVAQNADKWGHADPTRVLRAAASIAFERVAAPCGPDNLDLPKPAVADEVENTLPSRDALDTLLEALRAQHMWELLAECLDCYIGHPISEGRKLQLSKREAKIAEDKLGAYDRARAAYLRCWELSQKPRYLQDLVRVTKRDGAYQKAIRYQKKHFDVLRDAPDIDEDGILESGYDYAVLLLENDRRARGIEILEAMLQKFQSHEKAVKIRRKLAHTYASEEKTRAAIRQFDAFLTLPVQESNLEDWRRYVEVCWRQHGDVAKAYGLQWEIVKALPSRLESIDKLIELARADARLPECADKLQGLVEDVNQQVESQLLMRIAEMFEQDLDKTREALELYDRVHSLCDSGTDMHHECIHRRAFCLSRMTGREKEALSEFQKLVRVDPYEPTTYRGLKQLASKMNAPGRERIAGQILRALDCRANIENIRTKTRPSRAFSLENAKQLLLPDTLDDGSFQAIRAAVPLIEKVFQDELPQSKALNGSLVDSDDKPMLHRQIRAGLQAFNIDSYKLEIGDSGPFEPQIWGRNTPRIWLNRDLVDQLGSAECRFLGGYIGALSWANLTSVVQLNGRRLWHLLEGIYYYQQGEGFTERISQQTRRLADAVSSPFNAMARYRVDQVLQQHRDEVAKAEAENWPEAAKILACRAGLVLSGDVEASVETLLRFSNWELSLDKQKTQSKLERNDLVRDLFDFAVSDRFLQARYSIGLSGRPTMRSI